MSTKNTTLQQTAWKRQLSISRWESRFCIKCCRMFCKNTYSKSRKLYYSPSLPHQGAKFSNFELL